MSASNLLILLITCVAHCVALFSVAQTSEPLRGRIPKADPKKYEAIQDGQDWQNPKIFVRAEGIEVIGVTPPARGIPAESIPNTLQHLHNSAWPYGLVVAVWEIDLRSSNDDRRFA